MPEQENDIALIQMVLQGQQAAYATLVNRYQSFVFTIALRYVNNRELAEELAQDVFVKAYRCLADFKGNSKFSTWLYTIVHTTCLSHMRKRNNDALLPGDEQMHMWVDSSGSGQHPADILERRAQKHIIEDAIKLLPETDGTIITLFYQGDQSVEEIGSIVGLSPGNVKVRLFRARQKLREMLVNVAM